MPPPRSYAEWTAWLDRLARGDDDEGCLQALHAGSLDWTPGVAPLFVQRLGDEIQRRLRVCSERLTRDLGHASEESRLVRALLLARQQLVFVQQLCRLPTLPQPVQQQFEVELSRFAERAQSSLLETARADRSGWLASLIRHNALTRYEAAPPASVPAAGGAGPRGRKIILPDTPS